MELLTVREVAETLRVSPMTIRRYIADGKLSAVKVGRSVRVSREAIERFIEPVAPSAVGEREPAEEGVITFDDPLWDIVGIIKDGPPDLARNHDKYLAEAYADRHDG
jgi:excisionase family DNA binding protein